MLELYSVTIPVNESKKINIKTISDYLKSKTAVWTSRDNTIATVDKNGNVIGKKIGTTSIELSFTEANGSVIKDSNGNKVYFLCQVKVENSTTISINGKNLTVIGTDLQEADVNPVTFTGLRVHANGRQLEHVNKINGQVYVCLADIAPCLGLSVPGYFPGNGTEYPVQTTHTDVTPNVTYNKSYPYTQLQPCSGHGNNKFMVSLNVLMSDLGYSKFDKVTDVVYKNGAQEIFIQGPGYFISGQGVGIQGQIASIFIGVTPGIGDVKDVVESVSGRDILTGQELTTGERVLSAVCGVVPFVGASTIRGLTKVDEIVQAAQGLKPAERIIFQKSVWKECKPTLRGQVIERDLAKTLYKEVDGWGYIGRQMNGYFPVIDFIKEAPNLSQTVVVSLKTIDPDLYKLANGAYDTAKMENVINKYADALSEAKFLYGPSEVVLKNKSLSLVVPSGMESVIESLKLDFKVKGLEFKVIGY